MKRVEGYNNLYRNDVGAIINTDTSAYLSYKKRRDSNSKQEREIQSLSSQLKQAKDEIEELKELIRKALDAK